MDEVPLKKKGDITISVYKKGSDDSLFFSVKSDNEDLFDIEYIIEDVLKMY